jgi:hypothetical protein
MVEQRTVQRRRVLKTGSIEFGVGSAIDCTVRNVSNIGAAVEVASPFGIPVKTPPRCWSAGGNQVQHLPWLASARCAG